MRGGVNTAMMQARDGGTLRLRTRTLDNTAGTIQALAGSRAAVSGDCLSPATLIGGHAQQRYEELTGWKSPAAGGPTAKALTPEQKAIDQQARLIISRELGHERIQIVSIYCSK